MKRVEIEDRDIVGYGQEEGSIYTDEGKKRLWDEEKIIFVGGVHAFKIVPREKYSPLVKLYVEDDGYLYETDRCFDSSWLQDLIVVAHATIDKLAQFKK